MTKCQKNVWHLTGCRRLFRSNSPSPSLCRARAACVACPNVHFSYLLGVLVCWFFPSFHFCRAFILPPFFYIYPYIARFQWDAGWPGRDSFAGARQVGLGERDVLATDSLTRFLCVPLAILLAPGPVSGCIISSANWLSVAVLLVWKTNKIFIWKSAIESAMFAVKCEVKFCPADISTRSKGIVC